MTCLWPSPAFFKYLVMKITRILTIGCLAMALLAGCSEDPGESTKRPAGSGDEQPVDPDPGTGDSDVKSPVANFTCTAETTEIDVSTAYQTMEGFGASDCWLPATIGQYWATNRGKLSELLFSRNISGGQPAGIGLSMWRVNLGAGTAELGAASGINDNNANNRAESYLSGGKYDWSKCAGQRYFMQQAKDYGVESFVLFSNSPLVQYTLNGQGRSDSRDKANLKDDCYDDFAVYMAEVAAHFRGEGYNVTHVSPVNEPQYNWDGDSQEGSGWQNKEVSRLVRELDKALSAKGITTKILIPEAASWTYLYEGNGSDRFNQINVFFNPSHECYVGGLEHVDNIAGGHSYWTFDNWNDMRSIRSKVYSAATNRGVRVWQTEWSMLDKEPSELGGSYDDVSEFDIAQYMSRIIHNDIVSAGCSSWSYWTSMSVERYSQKNRFELIKTTPAGGEYSNDFKAEGKIGATHNLWVLGNYSLFVRPGYKRVALTAKENKDFFGTAYVSADGKTVVAVYTNYDKQKGVKLHNSFKDGKTPATVWRYTTTSQKHLQGDRFNPADDVFLDPASVTTIVYTFE